MDFLPIFLGYVLLFGMASLLVIFSNSSPLLSSILESIKCKVSQIISASVPSVVIRLVNQAIHYVFNTRNHVMQVIFGLLVVGGNAIFMLDILPLLYIFEPDHNHVLLPLVFLFSNLAAFHLSCTTHPGWISSSNAALLASLYKADGVMFKVGTTCRTCKLVKPPRSKHCNICNGCVHRFDHHCIWTNNCVGAGNLRFFLPFLITLMAMVVNGMVMGTRSLYLMVVNLRMMESGYVDTTTGQVAPVTIPILIQHLFMQHPRSVFLVTSLMMLTVLVGLFTLYHIFLVLSNQTTNERYKMSEITASARISSSHRRSHGSNHDQAYGDEQTKGAKTITTNGSSNEFTKTSKKIISTNEFTKTSKKNASNESSQVKKLGGFYSRGILMNLKEVFLPWSEFNRLKLKEKASKEAGNNDHKPTAAAATATKQRSGRR